MGIRKSRTNNDESWVTETTLTQFSAIPTRRSFLAPTLIKAIRMLPYYKESKRGRSRKKQIQITFIVIGIICIAFGKSFFIIVGVFFCLLALLIPVREVDRRNWIVGLKTKSFKTIKSTHNISVSISKKKIKLSTDSFDTELTRKKPRRVHSEDKIYVGFRDSKSNTRIWFSSVAKDSDWKGFEKNEKVDFIIDIPNEKVLELGNG